MRRAGRLADRLVLGGRPPTGHPHPAAALSARAALRGALQPAARRRAGGAAVHASGLVSRYPVDLLGRSQFIRSAILTTILPLPHCFA